ncbi:MAG: hypothetical protein IJG53_04725 [Eggerthellaceae bacterium]|nr:hypothetical protein [Eggerthellaceae bacterium]
MFLIISHDSALRFWRTFAGNPAVFRRLRMPSPMDRPVTLTTELLSELARLGFAPSKDRPLDLLFSGAGRSRAAAVLAHATNLPLPAGSLLQLSEHVVITSPELTFALVARKKDVRHLALMASELCGTYIPTPPGLPLGSRQPLTSTTQLQAVLTDLYPRQTAAPLIAAHLAFDGAASPMEAKLALLLSLPTRLGGYGLPRPQLNRPFSLSSEAQLVYPHSPCRLDLSWPGASLDVEYDGSGDEHSGDMHAKDVARLAALRLDGLDVLVLAKQQVYDPRAFAQMAQIIAGKLTGQPRRAWRIRAKDFDAKQAALREALSLE